MSINKLFVFKNLGLKEKVNKRFTSSELVRNISNSKTNTIIHFKGNIENKKEIKRVR